MNIATRFSYAGFIVASIFTLHRFYMLSITPALEDGSPDHFAAFLSVPICLIIYFLISAAVKWLTTGRFNFSLKY